MPHKIYGQNALLILGEGGDNPIIVSTPEEMANLLTSDNVGKFVKYIGETGDFEVPVSTGKYNPVNPVAVGDNISKWYFNTSVIPDFSQFDWENADYGPPDPGRRDINFCLTTGDSLSSSFINLKVSKYPKGNTREGVTLSEEAYTITDLDTRNTQDNIYVYVSTDELANALAQKWSAPGVKKGWIKGFSTWNISVYGDTVTKVAHQDVWGGYISKDGQWNQETILVTFNLTNNAIYQITDDSSFVRYYDLPELSDEGIASDLAQGKELINSKGEKVIGTSSGGIVKGIDHAYFIQENRTLYGLYLLPISIEGTVVKSTQENSEGNLEVMLNE